MTLRDLLEECSATIARRDAEVLAQHVLSRDRAWVLAHGEATIDDAHMAALRALVKRRAAQEPLQHLTSTQEFFGLPFEVNADVLIPRPETELLVEAVLAWLREQDWPRAPRILDVGTGSGAIAIALAKQHPHAVVTASDISSEALRVARRNAQENASDVHFVSSDLFAAFATTDATSDARGQTGFDVIVSNPPYVALADAPSLAREVVAHEPHLALFAGGDGLDVYRRLIPEAYSHLVPGGLLALEFGFGQREALRALFAGSERGVANWTHPRFQKDYAGIPRIVLANKLSEASLG